MGICVPRFKDLGIREGMVRAETPTTFAAHRRADPDDAEIGQALFSSTAELPSRVVEEESWTLHPLAN